MIFETERLLIRELKEEDFSAFHEMQSNPKVMLYTSGAAKSEESNRAEFDKCKAAYSVPGNDFWIWGVERKSDASFIGTCALVENNEIGYRFLEKYWGFGYGKELADGLIDFGLNNRQLKYIYATVEPENIASVKILEKTKLNFIEESFDEEEGCMLRYYKFEAE